MCRRIRLAVGGGRAPTPRGSWEAILSPLSPSSSPSVLSIPQFGPCSPERAQAEAVMGWMVPGPAQRCLRERTWPRSSTSPTQRKLQEMGGSVCPRLCPCPGSPTSPCPCTGASGRTRGSHGTARPAAGDMKRREQGQAAPRC